MNYGTAYRYTKNICWGPNRVCFQKKPNPRLCWPWWTHSQYCHILTKRRRNKESLLKNVPVTDSLERGLPPGRATRREYKVRVLEARYPSAHKGDLAEFKEHFERGDEDVCREPSGLVFRNQSSSAGACESKAGSVAAKEELHRDRRASYDSLRSRVFQAVGSDLIAPWLTPFELSRVELAFRCNWDWGQAWHYGKVKNKEFASKIEYLLPDLEVEYLLELYDKNELFQILWYLLPVDKFVSLATKHEHYPSIRKLTYLS